MEPKHVPFGSNAPSTRAPANADKPIDVIRRGKDAIEETLADGEADLAADLQALREDLQHLKDTVARIASRSGREAVRTVRDTGATLVSDMVDAGIDVACAATQSTKAMVSEVEAVTRRNPLGALGTALAVGIFIGWRRRR